MKLHNLSYKKFDENIIKKLIILNMVKKKNKEKYKNT
jgi:hypothetical protein